MKEYVAKFYMTVFEFLMSIMTKWIRSPIARICHSFDSNFFNHEIEVKRNKIKDLEHRLERQVKLEMERRVQQIPNKDEIAHAIASTQANFRVELELMKREMGESFRKTLLNETMNYLSARDSVIKKVSDDEISQATQALPQKMEKTQGAISNDHLETSLKPAMQRSKSDLTLSDTYDSMNRTNISFP